MKSNTKPIYYVVILCLLVIGMLMRVPIAILTSAFFNEVLILSNIQWQTTTVFWWGAFAVIALIQSPGMDKNEELLMKYNPNQLIIEKTVESFAQWCAWIFILTANYMFLTLWF